MKENAEQQPHRLQFIHKNTKRNRVDEILENPYIKEMYNIVDDTNGVYMDDFIGVRKLETMPDGTTKRYFIYVVPAETDTAKLEKIISFIVGGYSMPKWSSEKSYKGSISLMKVKPDIKDDTKDIVVFYSPYLSRVIVQTSGTCYYHAAVNAIIFNPYFRKYFYDTLLHEDNIYLFEELGKLLPCVLQERIDPSEIVETLDPSDAKDKLHMLTSPYFDTAKGYLNYEKNIEGSGIPIPKMLEILNLLYKSNPERVSVDNGLKEQVTGITQQLPEVWWRNLEHESFVDKETEVIINYISEFVGHQRSARSAPQSAM